MIDNCSLQNYRNIFKRHLTSSINTGIAKGVRLYGLWFYERCTVAFTR